MTLSPVVQTITADEARRLTDRIKVAVEGTWLLVVEAYQSRAWVALGHSSWDDYCTREFGTSRLRLPREDRAEQVASLREAGLSFRAIAAATGNDTKTIMKDLRGVGNSYTSPAPGSEPADEFDGSDWIEPDPQEAARQAVAQAFAQKDEPAKVTGLDGKSYPKPAKAEASRTPNRRSLPDQFFDANYDLTKVIERIERLAADDRFPSNAEKVGAKHRTDLLRAIDALQGVVDRLPQPQPKDTNDGQQ